MRSSSRDGQKKPDRVAFNQSRVRTFLRCEKAYYFKYDYPVEILGKLGELHPKKLSEGLRKGGWMHKLMQAHWLYISGQGEGWEKEHKLLSQRWERSMFDEERELYDDLPTECARLMTRYLHHYRADDEIFTIVRTAKGSPAVEFTVEVPLKKYGLGEHVFKGTIDILVNDLEYGGMWIRDAKWVRSIPGPDERMMSPQNIMYVWALRKLGYDVRGFIYDYGRTKSPAEPYILQNGSVTTRKRIDTDVHTYLRAIKKAHGKTWKSYARTVYKDKLDELRARENLWFRRERIPVEGPRLRAGFQEYIIASKRILERGEPIRNYIYNCKWNCDFHEPCVAQFQGLDITRLMKTQYRVEKERYEIQEID